MFRTLFQKCRTAIRSAWAERKLEPWTSPDLVAVAPAGTTEITIDLREKGREYWIGSHPSSQIVLESGPATAATLRVLGPDDGLLFTPWRSTTAGGFEPDEAAAVRVDAGNTLEVAGYVLPIVDPRPPAARYSPYVASLTTLYVLGCEWFNPFLRWSPRFLKTFSHDLAEASKGGTFERLPLLRKLGAVVHDTEEHAAEQMFQTGRRAFRWALLVYAALGVLAISSLPLYGARAASIGVALLISCALIATLITSWFSAAGAGLFWAFGGVVVGTLGPRIESPLRDPSSIVLFSLLFGVLGGWLGSLLESSWGLLPNSARPAREQFVPVAFSFFILAGPAPTTRLEWSVSAVAITLLIAWSVIGLPLCKRRLVRASEQPDTAVAHVTRDTLLLLDTAWTFWRRQAYYRIAAVLLAIVPLFGVLNWPQASERFLQHRTALDTRTTLVWADGVATATPPELFLIPDSWWEGWDPDLRWGSLTGQRVEVAAESRQFQELLATARVQDINALTPRTDGSAELWCQEAAGTPGSRTVYLSRCDVVERSLSELDAGLELLSALRFSAMLLLMLGFLVLWGARGDPASVTTALWCYGHASGVALVMSIDWFTSLDRLVAQWGFTPLPNSELLRVLYGAFIGLSAVSYLLGLLSIIGVPAVAMVFAWLIPPRRSTSGHLSMRDTWWRSAAIAATLAAGYLVTYVLIELEGKGLRSPIADIAVLSFALLVPVSSPLAVAWIVIARRGRSATALELTRWHMGLFVVAGLLVAVAGCAVFEVVLVRHAVWMIWPLTAALAVCAAVLVFRKRLWNLTGGRTLAAILSGALLSLAWGVLEAYALDTFQAFTTVAPLSARIVTVMITLAVLQPLYASIKRAVDSWTVSRNVRKAASGIPRLIELLIMGQATAHDSIRGLFDHELGLREYALYTLSSERRFTLVMSARDLLAPPELGVSDELRARLVRLDGVLDLDHAMYNLRFVTVSPELWRLSRLFEEKSWHLVPINLGEVLYGLLFVRARQASEPPEALSDPTVQGLRALAVATGKNQGM